MSELIIGILTQGFIYSILAYGIHITYKILDFPDLTVDGSFAGGAAITAFMLTRGCSPMLSLAVSIIFGALCGFVTGIINVKLKVRDLLAGIITMTALFSINLELAGSSLIIKRSVKTIFSSDLANVISCNR